jgi:DNA repair protein RadC
VNRQPSLIDVPATPKGICPKEFKPMVIRDCPPIGDACTTPQEAVDYWNQNVEGSAIFNPDVECFVALYLNTRLRIIGHAVVSNGTLDTILVHPREVFRLACLLPCAAVVLMHNHPSGDASPSEADITVTRQLIKAGEILKIQVTDHVVVGTGTGKYVSIRELGNCFFH